MGSVWNHQSDPRANVHWQLLSWGQGGLSHPAGSPGPLQLSDPKLYKDNSGGNLTGGSRHGPGEAHLGHGMALPNPSGPRTLGPSQHPRITGLDIAAASNLIAKSQ